MTVEVIGVITLLVGLLSFALSSTFIVYAFIISMLLGSAAATVLVALGGTSISPAHVLLGFLAIKLLNRPDIFRQAQEGLSFDRPGFWLLATALYGILSAYLLPRLFMGQTFIFPARTTGYLVPLAPATSNLTQSVYLVGDFVCFIVIYAYATSLEGRRVLGNAALICGALNLAFAVLDIATYFTGTTELLSIIRNANYSLLNETEVSGLKRITGTFVEASSFGSATLGFFAFSFSLWLGGQRTTLTGTLAALSLLALLLSTSTTAYVGLAGLLLFFYFRVLLQAFRKPVLWEAWFLLLGVPIFTIVAVLSILLNDISAAYFQNLIDTMVLSKMSTDSGVERSSWNTQGMQNFYDTLGFGVGNGSMRASSFPIAVLASLGIIGSLIFATFLTLVLLASKHHESDLLDSGYREAAKAFCIACLITATISGAFIDLGLAFFAFAALACSRQVSSRVLNEEELPLDLEQASAIGGARSIPY